MKPCTLTTEAGRSYLTVWLNEHFFFFFFIRRVTSSLESFGLLNDIFPFYSVWLNEHLFILMEKIFCCKHNYVRHWKPRVIRNL